MTDHDTTTPGGDATGSQPLSATQERESQSATGRVYAYSDPATLAKAGRIIRAALARRQERNSIPLPRKGDGDDNRKQGE